MPAKSTLSHPSSVLVLEDDQTMSDLICMALRKHGIQAVPCFNIKEATSALRENPEISAMRVDLSIPDGDGLDVLRTSGHLTPDLPCFMLTAKKPVESAVQAMKAGAQDYFTKPFDVYNMIRRYDLAAV